MKKLIIFLSLVSISFIVLFIYGGVSSRSIIIDGEEYEKIGKIEGYRIYEQANTSCNEGIREVIYTDEYHTFYFDCPIGSHYLIISNQETLTIDEVLDEEKLTISDLESVIPTLYKE